MFGLGSVASDRGLSVTETPTRGVLCCTIPAELHDSLIQIKIIEGIPVRLTVEAALKAYFEAKKGEKDQPGTKL